MEPVSTPRRRFWNLRVVMVLVSVALSSVQEVDAALGTWRVITPNSGISSMHSAVTHLGTVVLLHHTNQGPSNITFPGGRCRVTKYDRVLRNDCFAHSVILDPVSGEVRPLMVLTDTQCSSGQFEADGTLRQTGGDQEGTYKTRTLSPSCYGSAPLAPNQTCDWTETNYNLSVQRWYSTNQLLPDGRQIVVGGRHQNNLEFVPRKTTGLIPFPFLLTASSNPGPNVLYPFVHLLQKGTSLYIFAGRDSVIYDYMTDTILRTFDKIPGNPRNYPSGGSSVMLPLSFSDNYQRSEVLVCGGASVDSVGKRVLQKVCSITCGRIEVTKPNSTWVMEDMTMPRCMGDMVLLPDLNVLIINGAERGFQGWLSASVPTYNPVLYQPKKNLGDRFLTLDPTATPRLYHSTANLLPDASVMVAGSNVHRYYTFTKNESDPTDYPTELSVEAFTPPYAGEQAGGRPVIISVNTTTAKYKEIISLHFWDLNRGSSATSDPPAVDAGDTFTFPMSSSPWSTHSNSHGQRVFTLKPMGSSDPFVRMEQGVWVNDRTVALRIPSYATVAPASYYMLWVVKNGNPSQSCIWINIRR